MIGGSRGGRPQREKTVRMRSTYAIRLRLRKSFRTMSRSRRLRSRKLPRPVPRTFASRLHAGGEERGVRPDRSAGRAAPSDKLLPGHRYRRGRGHARIRHAVRCARPTTSHTSLFLSRTGPPLSSAIWQWLEGVSGRVDCVLLGRIECFWDGKTVVIDNWRNLRRF